MTITFCSVYHSLLHLSLFSCLTICYLLDKSFMVLLSTNIVLIVIQFFGLETPLNAHMKVREIKIF